MQSSSPRAAAQLSPDFLELLLTKLARLRLKVAEQKRDRAAWVSLPAAEHRQAEWFLQRDRESLAELETLVWLAMREKEFQDSEARLAEHQESVRALRASRPTLVPPPAPPEKKPGAPMS